MIEILLLYKPIAYTLHKHSKMSTTTYKTRSGRTVVAPVRFADTEFLPGSNNKYTKGRLVDRSFSSFGRHTSHYVQTYTPRVLDNKQQEEYVDSLLQDEEWVNVQLGNSKWIWRKRVGPKVEETNSKDDPDWEPIDHESDESESEDSSMDDVSDDSDWAEDEPSDDVLTDGDYESDGEEDEESENEDDWHHCQMRKNIQLEVRGRAIKIQKI